LEHYVERCRLPRLENAGGQVSMTAVDPVRFEHAMIAKRPARMRADLRRLAAHGRRCYAYAKAACGSHEAKPSGCQSIWSPNSQT
jgi:hypothetical protein